MINNVPNEGQPKPKRKKLNEGNIFVTMAQPKILTMEMPTLPTNDLVALYGRQSSLFQVLNNIESYDFQVEQQKIIIVKYGWKLESIREYFQDFAVSGTLGIGERVGITQLTEDIESGLIKAVFVQLVDRLFRDRNLENVLRFANVCAAQKVVIITTMRMYFMENRYDWEYFIEDCKRAWEQFDLQINQRMLPMRVAASHKGYYDSRPSDVGYTVDRNKRSSTYKKYILYLPQAEVIVQLYQRFIELGGNLPSLGRELEAMSGYHFPKYEDPLMHSKCGLLKVEGGYRIGSHKTLERLLSDVTYIGKWKTGNQTYDDNHDAILDKETWETVQYLIAKYKGKVKARRHGEDSILAGLVIRPSKDYIVSLDTTQNCICFALKPQGVLYNTAYQYIKLNTVEDMFMEIFCKRIVEDENAHGYAQAAQDLYEREVKNKAHVQNTIDGLQRRHNVIYADLNDPEIAATMTKQVKISKYEDLKRIEQDIARLQAERDKPTKGLPIPQLKILLMQIRKNYQTLAPAKLHQIIRLFTKGVELKQLSTHFWGFAVHWEVWGVDKGLIRFTSGSRTKWTKEEDAKLLALYEKEATEQDYLEAFPYLTPNALSTRLHRSLGTWPIKQTVHKPLFKVSLEDRPYVENLLERGLTIDSILPIAIDRSIEPSSKLDS